MNEQPRIAFHAEDQPIRTSRAVFTAAGPPPGPRQLTPPPLSEAADTTRNDSRSTLSVRRGPRTGQRFILAHDAVTTLGRHPHNDIALVNVTVSRRHAEIRPEAGRFVLVDLGSLSGSYVNQIPIDTAILAEGDELAIGAYRLTFHQGVGHSASGCRGIGSVGPFARRLASGPGIAAPLSAVPAESC